MSTTPELDGGNPGKTPATNTGGMRCPYCRSFNVRGSRMRLPQDLLPMLILHHPLRCRTCNARFLRWLWVKAPQRESPM